jgi:prevent-host-death family protein
MAAVPEIFPISDLRQDAAAVLKRACFRRQPIVITQRGRAAAVMVGDEECERAEREREILMLLARGEQEIDAGAGSELDAVLAEADALLAMSRR